MDFYLSLNPEAESVSTFKDLLFLSVKQQHQIVRFHDQSITIQNNASRESQEVTFLKVYLIFIFIILKELPDGLLRQKKLLELLSMNLQVCLWKALKDSNTVDHLRRILYFLAKKP